MTPRYSNIQIGCIPSYRSRDGKIKQDTSDQHLKQLYVVETRRMVEVMWWSRYLQNYRDAVVYPPIDIFLLYLGKVRTLNEPKDTDNPTAHLL